MTRGTMIAGDNELRNRSIKGKDDFLKTLKIAVRILQIAGVKGFLMGGGAVDFVLGKYRRPHGDIDMVYVVESVGWQEYLSDPLKGPKERNLLRRVVNSSRFAGIKQDVNRNIALMGASGIKMRGGKLKTEVDFIEAYRYRIDGESHFMLPIYNGKSYIKIPENELVSAELGGIKCKVPSVEVQYLIKEQSTSLARTLKGGPFPDLRMKSKTDLKDLGMAVNKNKLTNLKNKGVGFNVSLKSAVKYRVEKLLATSIVKKVNGSIDQK